MDLSSFDGKRIAVLVDDQRGHSRALPGLASYEQDEMQNVLMISLDPQEPGRPTIVIRESEWEDDLPADTEFGCDFCLRLTRMSQVGV